MDDFIVTDVKQKTSRIYHMDRPPTTRSSLISHDRDLCDDLVIPLSQIFLQSVPHTPQAIKYTTNTAGPAS